MDVNLFGAREPLLGDSAGGVERLRPCLANGLSPRGNGRREPPLSVGSQMVNGATGRLYGL